MGGRHDWNVPDEAHRALRVPAARHGHSAEAEIRDILEPAVTPAKRVCLGDALAALGRKIGLTNEGMAIIDQMSDRSPAKPMKFESSRRAPGVDLW
jgi:plasmid stability protein